jgi:uncharacterized protein (TIGR02996 family)
MSNPITARLRDLVLANPRDAAVRSVYADALIQDGDPRGTFIILQSQLAERISPDRREDARRQADELFKANRDRWTEPASWAEVRFRGGFIHAIRAKAAAFLEKGSALLATEPVLDVTLTQATDEHVKALAALRALARLSDLTVQGSFKDGGAAVLVKSPHLRALTALNLKAASLGKGFAGSVSSLTSLEVLALTGMNLGDEAITVFASETHPALQRLYLARNELTDEGLAALAGSSGLAALRVLCLGGNEISDEGVAALAAAKHLANLTILELNRTGVSDEGAEALARSKTLRSLKKVDLSRSEVSRALIDRLRKQGKLVIVT